MDSILTFIGNAPEVREWGSDITLTITTIIINILFANQVLGTVKQVGVVLRSRSVEGVSVTMMTYFAFYFLAFFVYAIDQGSLNMAIAGTQFVIYVPIILAAWLYGKAGTRRTVLITTLVFALIPVVMYVTPWKNSFLLILLLGILFTQYLMYRELKKADGVGSFEVHFAWAFLVASLVWFVFGVMRRDVALMIFNPLAAITLGATIALYYKKRGR